MTIRSAFSWVIGETMAARRQRHDQAASTAARLVRDLSVAAYRAHGGLQTVPMGAPIDLSPTQWRGDELPDAVMFPLPVTSFVREGSVQVHRSATGSRIIASADPAGSLGHGDRLVLIATTATSAEAVMLQRDSDRADGPLRGELHIAAPPADVDIRLVVISPTPAHRQERG